MLPVGLAVLFPPGKMPGSTAGRRPAATPLLGDGEVHVVGIVKDPAAIAAGDQFLFCLALNEQLGG